MKNNLRTSSFGLATIAMGIFSTSALAITAPDLPMAGWATQNGGTTGGAGKTVVTVSNVSDLRKYAEAGNYTIYVKPGTYKVASKDAIKVGDNVTIYGYQGAIMEQTYTGTTNEDNTVMNITGKNIIIRNLTFKGAGAIDKDAGDCLHVQGGTNVWLDHLDVYDGEDGNLDVINGANYVTISWVKFSYTSASSEHQFSNLIGNSDNKTSDSGKLKTTLHHNWWADGVKERMPRVRFGQVHVANNLFSSNNSSTCVRAAKQADLRVENNVFISVNNPIDLYEGDYTAVLSSGNYSESIKKGAASSGTNSSAFTPSYSMGLTDVSTQAKAYALRDSIQNYAGATLPNPGESGTVTTLSSSSVAASSSSVAATSSATVTSSSSVATDGTATLAKHGTGSTKQTVAQGESIQEFYFTITGATGATVTGLPDGITGTLNGSDFYISGTVSTSAAAGDYAFTVTTTGASTNASKSGTITVTAASSTATSSSSEAVAVSSSSVTAVSSSSEAGTVIVPESSSSETAAISSSETVEPTSSSEAVIESSDAGVEPESSSSEDKTIAIRGFSAMPKYSMDVVGHRVSIDNAAGMQLSVFDMQGRVVHHARIGASSYALTLPMSGTYLVRVGKNTSRISIK